MLSAIIVAAGQGKRLKAALPKPLVKIGKFPAIIYSLSILDQHPQINEIIVVVNVKNQQEIKQLIKKRAFKKIKCLVLGGKERQDSVYNGLKAVSNNSDWVLIHDSARPFIDPGTITQVVLAAKKAGAAIVAVRPKATIKCSGKNNFIAKTFDRNNLWRAQTPQVFEKALILQAYNKFAKGKVTDDASLVEKLGQQVKLVQGKYENIKITTAEDLLLAGLIAKGSSMQYKVGIGYDIHRLIEGRKLFLGAVEIPYVKGLLGHSDGDAVIHALCDALLGALGMGDIGEYFPDTDPKYQGIASSQLLTIVKEQVDKSGYKINNLDVIIITQEPKLMPFKKHMKEKICALLGVEQEVLNIKAKTNEGLDAVGRLEAIACFASASLIKGD